MSSTPQPKPSYTYTTDSAGQLYCASCRNCTVTKTHSRLYVKYFLSYRKGNLFKIFLSGTDSAKDHVPGMNKNRNRTSISSSSSCSSSCSSVCAAKGKKRTRNEALWERNERKTLRNSGKAYISKSGKVVNAREMKPTCTDKCRFACASTFSSNERKNIFENYWALASLQRQRNFLFSCISILQVKYRRVKETGVTKWRKPNCCFSFPKDGKFIRVCKTFLLNTLGIKVRTLRTVIESKTSGIPPTDRRGRHSKHVKIDPEIRQSVKDHINSTPRFESDDLRASTSQGLRDDGLTAAEMYQKYKQERESLKKVPASYDLYARMFNKKYII